MEKIDGLKRRKAFLQDPPEDSGGPEKKTKKKKSLKIAKHRA